MGQFTGVLDSKEDFLLIGGGCIVKPLFKVEFDSCLDHSIEFILFLGLVVLDPVVSEGGCECRVDKVFFQVDLYFLVEVSGFCPN